jgi:Tol biopolymer transport system component
MSPALGRVVRRCLAKDPDARWQSAGDMADELKWLADGGGSPDRAPAKAPKAPARSAWSRALPWTVAGVAGAALAGVLLAWPLRQAPAAATRITLSLSLDNALQVEGGTAISPDGRTVAFAARSASGSCLYIRRLDEWEPHAVPLTAGATCPFFSPDGRWIAFSRAAGLGLEKVPVAGGPPQVICTTIGAKGRWQSDGSIVFGAWPQVGLWRVSSDGGAPQLITGPREGNGVWYEWPEPLPDDRGILFTIRREGRTSIVVLPRGAPTPRVLVESGSHPRYLPSGHLVYVADGHLMAVPFDVDRLAVRGGATIVIDDMNDAQNVSSYDVSATGVLVYLPARSFLHHIVWKDRQGLTVPVVTRPRRYGRPVLSPDGARLAVVIYEGPSRNVWTGRVADEPLTRLTFGNDDDFPLWSRDGSRLFYTAGRNGTYNIFWVAADGSGNTGRLFQSPNPQAATSVSPTGDTLLFNDNHPNAREDIGEYSVSRKESRSLVKASLFDEGDAMFSPDGRWVAYMSDESGQKEVYVRPYGRPGGKQQVSTDGGSVPVWGHTGRELFYQTTTALFAVPILDASELRFGPPQRLFATSATTRVVPAYTSADDQRFLMLEMAEPHQASQLNVVQNWFEELKAKVPIR